MSASRRRYLQGIGALAAVNFGSGNGAATGKKRIPTPYRKKGAQSESPTSEVYLKHFAELPSAKAQITAYERNPDVGYVLSAQLRGKLGGNSPKNLDLTVNTTGERTSVTTSGQFGRTVHGWRPTAEEVKELASFGDVIYVPEVSSTKVGLSNVHVSDIKKIASLDFVLEIGYDPEIKPIEGTNGSVTTQASSLPTADDLKSSSHMDFDSVFYDLTSLTQIGIIGDGYTGQTDWSKTWAESIGIDTGKAKDFIGSDWRTGGSHGTNVADTAAYMLKDGDPHSDLFVPLQVWEPGYGLVKGSYMRNAIEYALTNDIAVVNISVETAEHESYCTSTACEELDSYTSAGYMAAVAAGNDSIESKVCHPATSHFSITAGGYSGSCSGGYHRHSSSNYGRIRYIDEISKTTYCHWCYADAGSDEFQSNVYGCYIFNTDGGNRKRGTSFSSPMVAAAGAIRHSVHGSDSYSDKLSDFNNMNNKIICESEASWQGDVLHVPDVR